MKSPEEILKEIYGYNEFRPKQKEIIEHTLSGQDSVVIMPTGGGKSICFQIPALMLSDLTIVISPLISLMKDQVDTLKANGVEAEFFNSSLSDIDRQVIIEKAIDGKLNILYISPESLKTAFQTWLQHVTPSLIAVDEAHCVSMWGHDFRPEYAEIKEIRERFSNVPMMALTATADKATRNDISNQLGLKSPQLFLSSFKRDNLSLTVRSQVPKKDKIKEVIRFIGERKNESGIIYCLSRKECEEWSQLLQDHGFSAAHYHAGLTSNQRDHVQEAFLNDQINVICATIAFGMGIDKSNVRWIIHNNLPKNIEGYYQEIGRSGRDGLPADTVLYYNYRDVKLLNDFVSDSGQKEINTEKIKRMLQYTEAVTCRRNILLSYFGEYESEPCGNCDRCDAPAEYSDATTIVQKAMSAIIRSKESLGINLLINVLRGAKTIEIAERKLNTIKTYGAGGDMSFKDWQHYITQMINVGIIEIAYDDNMKLKVTDAGHLILRNKESLALPRPLDLKEKAVKKKEPKNLIADAGLLGKLKNYRLEIAKQNSVPAYVIFHDKTLKELASKKPKNLSELGDITGMGKVKVERFGEDILKIIGSPVEQTEKSKKMTTYEVTWELYQQGMNPEEIAHHRELAVNTVYGHLCKLFVEGREIDLHKYITEYQVNQVKEIRRKLDTGEEMKPIYEALQGELDYAQIGMALTILSKHN